MKLTPEEEQLIKDLRAKKQWKPRGLDEYEMFDKVEKFNQLYDFALESWEEIKNKRKLVTEVEYFCFEKLMNLLNRPEDPKLWEEFNKMIG